MILIQNLYICNDMGLDTMALGINKRHMPHWENQNKSHCSFSPKEYTTNYQYELCGLAILQIIVATNFTLPNLLLMNLKSLALKHDDKIMVILFLEEDNFWRS